MTATGLRDLILEARAQVGPSWDTIRKRWITSFDYLRTEPVALELVCSAPNSRVRVNDVTVLAKQGCVPSVPFHPKVFIVGGDREECVLAGSGNLSRSGLRRGHEAGLLVGVPKPFNDLDKIAIRSLKRCKSWYNALWRNATDCDRALITRYKTLYSRADNLRHPAPTEDDVTPAQMRRNQLSPEDLRKLRACEYFWIEAGNVTKNLGPRRPGNQLMMTPLSRVFFGVPPVAVPQNSPLTHVEIAFAGNEPRECSLTFSDNGMDKLTLPLPGTFGPAKYDNQNLLFRRIQPGCFALNVGTASERRTWKRRSKAISASFTMTSGRAWGVF